VSVEVVQRRGTRGLRADCGSGERSLRVRLHEARYLGPGICSALSDLILDLIMVSASLYRYLTALHVPLLLMHLQYL
jgi:hypothetical protein